MYNCRSLLSAFLVLVLVTKVILIKSIVVIHHKVRNIFSEVHIYVYSHPFFRYF